MAAKKLVVRVDEATKGVLHGGAGTFRVLIDEPTCGAKHVSLLTNTSNAGTVGSAHQHDVEHYFYILSGTGTMHIGDESYALRPETAVFVPPHTMHQIVVDDGADLNYIVLYAPPGPEQQLIRKQARAFDEDGGSSSH